MYLPCIEATLIITDQTKEPPLCAAFRKSFLKDPLEHAGGRQPSALFQIRPNALDFFSDFCHICTCIKSRADALANLPPRARWFPQGDVANSATKRVARAPALLGQTDGGFFNVWASQNCDRSLYSR
jgi:hypothetical protein